MAGLVYYSSASGNTERFMHKLGLPAMRIPVDESAPMPEPDAPFVLISPTYADGEGHGAVARQVIRFLNDPDRLSSAAGRNCQRQPQFRHDVCPRRSGDWRQVRRAGAVPLRAGWHRAGCGASA